jgi:hypothetical protein
MQTMGARLVNEPIKSISAIKRYPRAKRKRGGETMMWKRTQSLTDEILAVHKISREVKSEIAWLVTHEHLNAVQGEAARRYAYIIARFEKYSIEGRRIPRSPSYERAFGEDQELERLSHEIDGLDVYERRAKQAKKDYRKLIKVLDRFPGAKGVLDDMCCSDIPIASEYRRNAALVLSAVAKAFGVTVTPHRRRGRR